MEESTLAILSPRTFILNNVPFSYPLTTKQTPNCEYQSSGWAVTASGSNTAYLPNFETIDANTGVYSVPGMNQAERAGTYTISVSAVVVNGVPYGLASLVLPNSFELSVGDGCSTTVVTASTVTDIYLKVWDPISLYPLSGAAFTDFSDTISTASGNSSLC